MKGLGTGAWIKGVKDKNNYFSKNFQYFKRTRLDLTIN